MSKKRKESSSFWISTIIAFLLSIFLTLASYLGGIYFGLFNKTLILDSINKTSYYNAIMDYTLENAKALVIPLGLDESIFDSVFNLDETYTQGKAMIQSDLNNERYVPDTSGMKQRLTANINTYLQKQNLTATQEQQQNIASFADSIASEYTKNLSVPYIKYYANSRIMFSKLVIIGLPVFLVLSAFSIFLLIRLHKWLHRSLRFITYSTLSAALMTAVLPIILLINGAYKRINVRPEYFYNFLINYIHQSIMTFVYIALLLLAISIALIAAIYFKRRELTKSKHHHRHHNENASEF